MDEKVECVVCGEEIKKENAKYEQGNLADGAKEKLKEGGTFSFDEIFEFDDGPYCSFDCMEAEK